MKIQEHLNKNNPHHAYLLEGARDEILPDVLKFCEDLKVETSGNPDFYQISYDNLKIDEAFSLREMSSEKSFSLNKKIFIICANSITLDAQNVLLKMFEEPIHNTHFFVIVPEAGALLKTLVSRFYLISPRQDLAEGAVKDAEKFISMSLNARINFLKEFLTEEEDEETIQTDSARAKSLIFLNNLEFALHQKAMSRGVLDISFFGHFFKVREFLRMPGSSTKSLMESVALVVPNI